MTHRRPLVRSLLAAAALSCLAASAAAQAPASSSTTLSPRPRLTAAPERAPIAAGLAEERIEVKVNYSGARIVLFGSSPVIDDPTAGFAVVLLGPEAPHRIARRTRDGVKSFAFVSAPMVFALAVEPNVTDAAPPDVLAQAGLNARAAAMPAPELLDAHDLEDWRAALVNLKMDGGLYRIDETRVERLEGGLLRAQIDLPADAPTGDYRVRALVFRDGRLLGETEQKLVLERGGLDRTLFNLAHQHGVVYGFVAILMATAIGLIAARVGRG